jgi:hypothetical protein
MSLRRSRQPEPGRRSTYPPNILFRQAEPPHSFYGLYLYNEGEVRLWPYARANGAHPVEVLRRLRAEWPEDKLIVVWDGAS